jgi:hypothetical protein
MSNYYDTMQVCGKCGNQITAYYDSSPNHRQKRCDKCGSETAIKCLDCQAKIRGKYHSDSVLDLTKKEVPWNCHECGAAYPWRTRLVVISAGKVLLAPIKYGFDSIIGLFKK